MDLCEHTYNYIYNKIKSEAFVSSGNNIIFEFTAAQTSSNYTLIPQMYNVGFPDVNAIAVIEIPANLLDKLFYFETDGTTGLNMNIIKYGINTQYKFNLPYSDASLTNGYYVKSTIKIDFLTYLAYCYSRSTNLNIFANLQQLIEGVVDLDKNFNNTLNSNIANSILHCPSSDSILLINHNNSSNPFYSSTEKLLYGMLNIANNDRKNVFFDDIKLQDNSQNIYWEPFHDGDIMSVLINYVTQFGIRSYKIALVCGPSFILPPPIVHIIYNSNGNLDPFYILSLLQISFDENFATNFNQSAPILIPTIYNQIGFILNPIDLYFKTFMSNVTQPCIVNNGIINNGLNPSFQYIYLNSTITDILYPSLRTIKASLITSPYNLYPALHDIKDIECDLNFDNSQHFIIRIYTRPIYSSIDNALNILDNFYGNYYDSDISYSGTLDYKRYHLTELFTNWNTMIYQHYNQRVFYKSGLINLTTLGEQEILSICLYTNTKNANIGIKNIMVTYK